MPSPALTIAALQMRASRWQAPDEAWRSTIMLGAMASRFIAVSTSVSPLTTLDEAIATLSVSALRRFSAISNEVRVRVLGSKNRLTTVWPRSVGTFLMARFPTSFIASAVSRISTISSGVRSAMPSRLRWLSAVAATASMTLLPRLDGHLVDAIDLLQADLHTFLARGRHVLADVVGLDRQLAMAAVDQDHELDGSRPSEVDQRVERGARRPAGVEHVVDEDYRPVVDGERDLGLADERLRPDRGPHQ